MVLGLRTNSATWLSRFPIKSSAMDRFFKTVTLEVLTKKVVHFDLLRHWQKDDTDRMLLIDCSNLLPNYL